MLAGVPVERWAFLRFAAICVALPPTFFRAQLLIERNPRKISKTQALGMKE
jgi:hypothetical protein